MRVLSEDCLKKFVSLAQKEAGRNRAAATENEKAGDGLHLRHLLDGVSESKLEKLKSQRG